MSVYEIITDRVVKLLESGTAPWRRPWNAGGGLPKNLVSGKDYRGINVFLLHAAGYESPYFLTFKQAKDFGGSVRKGEHGYPVIFWKFQDEQDLADDEGDGGLTKPKRRAPILRY